MVDPRSAAVLDKPTGETPTGDKTTGGQPEKGPGRTKTARPTPTQLAWLHRGLDQPGGKLPLFDRDGQLYNPRTIRSCIEQGWAEPWIENPLKPDWLVCRLTEAGHKMASSTPIGRLRPVS